MEDDPIADKLHKGWLRANKVFPDLQKIAEYVGNRGTENVIIASAPNVTELEDGVVIRRRLPIFWGTDEQCVDLMRKLQEITDWKLTIH